MRTIATQKLTLTYLQRLNWQSYLAALLAAFMVLFSAWWMFFHIGGDKGTTLFADSLYAVAALTGAAWCLITAYRARYGSLKLEPRYQFVWLLIGIGEGFNALGGIYYTYLEYSGHINPVPSFADLCFSLNYPLLLAGVLLMPAAFKLERFRVRIGIDALITTLCLLGASWFFFIGPAFLATNGQNFIDRLVTTLLYPFLDMLLIFAIALLIVRPAERLLRPSLILIGIGMLASVWGDTGYSYTLAIGTYTSGTVYIDPFWYISSLLVGLAALFQYTAIARHTYNERTSEIRTQVQPDYTPLNYPERQPQRSLFVQSFLVYIPLIILLLLTIYGEATHDQDLTLFLVILISVIGILLVVRYLLTGYENELLLQEREQRRREAEQLRLLTAQLTEMLDLEPLLERIAALASSALAFDAALLIVEEHPTPSTTSGAMGVYAAVSAIDKIVSWRFYGSGIAYCDLFHGRELEVMWTQHIPNLPPEVAIWHTEQRIQTTLFIPLTYQGKILGSLGFASRAMRSFSQHEKYIARAFAEQAATTLEHAYLYREAREHEAFSTALANIATRLNAAVVEQIEMQQIICTEGASALRADYALLYVSDQRGSLVPVALSVSEQEPVSLLSDWPAIYEHEHEAQALILLQPTLLQIDPLYTLDALAQPTSDYPFAHVAYSTTRRHRIQRALSLREVLARRHVPTAILAPLITRNNPAGLLVLARSLQPGARDSRAFTVADLQPAQDFAEQAAVAFTNAQLYQQLHTAHRQLQELDQVKDQFMITASHELRTPLTAVQGYLELIAQYDEALPPEQRREFLHKAQRSCEELVLLLSNVMDASRLEVDAGIRAAHIEDVPLLDLVQDMLELIEPQVTQEQREVHVHIPAHLAVRADPGRLRQILLNLSMNALKYSPPGSPLTFSAHTVTERIPYAVISVADKGLGILPKDQARLFQRFERLERDLNSPVRGSGLGLYISRRLVEAMKGRIWIESSGITGEGAALHVQLPLAH
ncbi:MAG: ATP-binding protein [Chloroflexota bacterium]|nr:ATP-binding protein [Chloroflexota bacterium]